MFTPALQHEYSPPVTYALVKKKIAFVNMEVESDSKCASTSTYLKFSLPQSEKCPPFSQKDNNCCAIQRKKIREQLARPTNVASLLRALEDDELQTVKGFLVQGDYDLSDDATLGKDFWRSLRAKHKNIANKLMYQKGCTVPNALVNEVYEDTYTDSLQCFVNYIVTSIGKKKDVMFMKSLDNVVQARAETIKTIMKTEEVITYKTTSRHKMVHNGLFGIIPHQCAEQDTLFLCTGLVVNRKLQAASTETVTFPFELSAASMRLLLQHANLFLKLYLKRNNPLVIDIVPGESDTEGQEGFIELSAKGTVVGSTNISSKRLISLVRLPSVLKLKNCNIQRREFYVILQELEAREQAIDVLDLGNNPLGNGPSGGDSLSGATPPKVLVSHMLLLNSCNVDTIMARRCLAICEGQLDLSNNRSIDWKKLAKPDATIRIKELVATGMGSDLHLSDAFSGVRKLCCDRAVIAPIAKMPTLATLCLAFKSASSNRAPLTIALQVEDPNEITIGGLMKRTMDEGKLQELVLGGKTASGDTFASKLNAADSERFSNALIKKGCKLQVLGLSYCNIENVEAMIACTLHLRHLQELYIAKLANVKKFRAIGQTLRLLLSSSKTLRVLGLNDNAFDEGCIADILHGLNENESLMKLHMSQVPIHPAMLTFHDTDGHHPLQVLELDNLSSSLAEQELRKGLPETGSIADTRFFPFLMESLTKFTQLRTLKCRKLVTTGLSWSFDSKLMQNALTGLRSLEMLQHLDLSECNLDTECLVAVFEALRNSPVERLMLDGNNSGDFTVFNSIVKCLQYRNSKIQVLSIKNVFTRILTIERENNIHTTLVNAFPAVAIRI